MVLLRSCDSRVNVAVHQRRSQPRWGRRSLKCCTIVASSAGMAVPASCACGKNKLSVSGQPSAVYRCHCTDCRRLLPKGEQYLHNACFAAEQVRTQNPHPPPRRLYGFI